jgi:hypothetical protein
MVEDFFGRTTVADLLTRGPIRHDLSIPFDSRKEDSHAAPAPA